MGCDPTFCKGTPDSSGAVNPKTKTPFMEESTKDKVQGNLSQATGAVKEKVGEATNNPDMQDEGTVEKLKGKVQEKVGDIKKVFEN